MHPQAASRLAARRGIDLRNSNESVQVQTSRAISRNRSGGIAHRGISRPPAMTTRGHSPEMLTTHSIADWAIMPGAIRSGHRIGNCTRWHDRGSQDPVTERLRPQEHGQLALAEWYSEK